MGYDIIQAKVAAKRRPTTVVQPLASGRAGRFALPATENEEVIPIMHEYAVMTDATADLPASLCEELNIHVIPMSFSFSETESYLHYPDCRQYAMADFYQRLRAGDSANTSQITVAQAYEAFQPLLAEGLDIFYLCFSSGLSGSCNSARLAAEQLKEEYPERQIIVLDSRAASMGEGLLAWYAAINRQQGLTLAENTADIEEKVQHLAHWFTVDDLYHLKRGGRCTALAAFMGTVLNIKPLLHVDDAGRLIPMEKVRSHKKTLDRMVEIAAESGVNLAEQTIFIGHGDAAESAERLAEKMRTLGVRDIVINYIGPVIGAHSGAGTVALFFLAKQK